MSGTVANQMMLRDDVLGKVPEKLIFLRYLLPRFIIFKFNLNCYFIKLFL